MRPGPRRGRARERGAAAGGRALTIYAFPAELETTYGRRPVSAQVFLHIRFGSHDAHQHEEKRKGRADHGGMAMPMPMPR